MNINGKTRITVTPAWRNLWFTLRYQVEVGPDNWATLDTFRTRSIKCKPKDAPTWVWGFLIMTGVVTTPKLEVA